MKKIFCFLLLCCTSSYSFTTNELATFNQLSLSSYDRAKTAVLKSKGLYIISTGTDLVFYHEGKREAINVLPEEFNVLKTSSHLMLGIFGYYRLNDIKGLIGYRDALLNIQSQILASSPVQKPLIQFTLKLIDATLIKGRFDKKEFDEYVQLIKPMLMVNIQKAAVAQLIAMNKTMMDWKKKTRPSDWNSIIVVILGSHSARDHSLQTQYFSRLFDIPISSSRLIYAEGLRDEAQALGLLSSVLIDNEIGVLLFKDANKMQKDVLGDAAQSYLEKQFPRH